jgi:clan AA aspartic protease
MISGSVMVKVKLTNWTDTQDGRRGLLPPEGVRSLELDVLVDTGAVEMALPEDVVSRLGVPLIGRRTVRVADGRRIDVGVAGGLEIEILGRFYQGSVLVLPAGTTPLLGQIPLEALDLVVVPGTREVITNPAHPDGPVLDLLGFATTAA